MTGLSRRRVAHVTDALPSTLTATLSTYWLYVVGEMVIIAVFGAVYSVAFV